MEKQIMTEEVKTELNKLLNYFNSLKLNDNHFSATQYSSLVYKEKIIDIQIHKSIKKKDVLSTCNTLCNIINGLFKKNEFFAFQNDTESKNLVLTNIDFNDKKIENTYFNDFYNKITQAQPMEDIDFMCNSNYVINRLYDNDNELIIISKGKPFIKSNDLYYEIEYDTHDEINKNDIKKINRNLLRIPTNFVTVVINKTILLIGDYGRAFFGMDHRAEIISDNNIKNLESYLDGSSINYLKIFVKEKKMYKEMADCDTSFCINATLNSAQVSVLKTKGVLFSNNTPLLTTDHDCEVFVGLLSGCLFKDEANHSDVIAKVKRKINP